jgi:hypothetical protein
MAQSAPFERQVVSAFQIFWFPVLSQSQESKLQLFLLASRAEILDHLIAVEN